MRNYLSFSILILKINVGKKSHSFFDFIWLVEPELEWRVRVSFSSALCSVGKWHPENNIPWFHITDFRSYSPLPVPFGCTWCSLTLASVYTRASEWRTHMASHIWWKRKICFRTLTMFHQLSPVSTAPAEFSSYELRSISLSLPFEKATGKKKHGDLHPENYLVNQLRVVSVWELQMYVVQEKAVWSIN